MPLTECSRHGGADHGKVNLVRCSVPATSSRTSSRQLRTNILPGRMCFSPSLPRSETGNAAVRGSLACRREEESAPPPGADGTLDWPCAGKLPESGDASAAPRLPAPPRASPPLRRPSDTRSPLTAPPEVRKVEDWLAKPAPAVEVTSARCLAPLRPAASLATRTLAPGAPNSLTGDSPRKEPPTRPARLTLR